MPTLPINALGLPFGFRGAAFPPILNDGNTVAWFDMAEKYITKDGSDFVSQWDDRSGNDNHLLQAVGTNQPLWSSSGVLFDGVDNFLKAVAFTFNQPEQIYLVVKQVAWTSNRGFFDGEGSTSGLIFQNASTPGLTANAGNSSAQNDNLAVGTFGIIRVLFDGVNGKFQINETAALTGDYGANNMGGFQLGHYAGTQYSNIEVKEVILRKIDDTDPNEQIIYDYLKDKYSL